MSSLKSFFKDTVIYGISAVLPRFISVALVPIFTSTLNLKEFSDQTTWYVYAAFFNVILTMGMETAFFRFYTREENKDNVISTSFILLTISSLSFLLLGYIFNDFLTEFLGFANVDYLYILLWITVLDTMVVIPFAYLRVTNRPIKFMIFKLANVFVLYLVTAVLLIFIPIWLKNNQNLIQTFPILAEYKLSVIHILLANLFASFFTLVFVVPEIIKIQWKFDKSLMLSLFRYSWPVMVGGLAYVVNENMDKLIIQDLIDKDANGIYSACYKLGVFMTLYITAFRMGAEPFFFNHSGQLDAKLKYSVVMTWFVIFGCLFMLIVVGFIDMLAGVLIRNPDYFVGIYIVPIILLANLFSGIYNNLSIWYKLTDRTQMGMYISIFGAILTIVSLYLLIPRFGILGGALATLITYFSMSAISYFFGSKHFPIQYDVKKILGYILVSSLLSGISFLYFREHYMISILFVVAFIACVMMIEKMNISSIKKWV